MARILIPSCTFTREITCAAARSIPAAWIRPHSICTRQSFIRSCKNIAHAELKGLFRHALICFFALRRCAGCARVEAAEV